LADFPIMDEGVTHVWLPRAQKTGTR
jgi:hypothetical protein